MPIVFVEVGQFNRQREECGFSDAEFERMCAELEANPRSGDEVPEAGGAYKHRFPDKKRQKGRQGGLRIYYYYLQRIETIFLFAVYNKNTVDLTHQQRRKIAEAIQGLEAVANQPPNN